MEWLNDAVATTRIMSDFFTSKIMLVFYIILFFVGVYAIAFIKVMTRQDEKGVNDGL